MELLIIFVADQLARENQGTCPNKYRRVNNNFREFFLFILLTRHGPLFVLSVQVISPWDFKVWADFSLYIVFFSVSLPLLIRRQSKLLHVKMRDDVKSCVTHNAFLTSAVIQSIHRVCMNAEVNTWDDSFFHFYISWSSSTTTGMARGDPADVPNIVRRSVAFDQCESIVSLSCVDAAVPCSNAFFSSLDVALFFMIEKHTSTTMELFDMLSNMKNVTKKNGRLPFSLWPMKSLILLSASNDVCSRECFVFSVEKKSVQKHDGQLVRLLMLCWSI